MPTSIFAVLAKRLCIKNFVIHTPLDTLSWSLCEVVAFAINYWSCITARAAILVHSFVVMPAVGVPCRRFLGVWTVDDKLFDPHWQNAAKC